MTKPVQRMELLGRRVIWKATRDEPPKDSNLCWSLGGGFTLNPLDLTTLPSNAKAIIREHILLTGQNRSA